MHQYHPDSEDGRYSSSCLKESKRVKGEVSANYLMASSDVEKYCTRRVRLVRCFCTAQIEMVFARSKASSLYQICSCKEAIYGGLGGTPKNGSLGLFLGWQVWGQDHLTCSSHVLWNMFESKRAIGAGIKMGQEGDSLQGLVDV